MASTPVGTGTDARGRKPGGRAKKLRRNARIREEFDGYNYRDLAVRYGLSERMIRYIVRA